MIHVFIPRIEECSRSIVKARKIETLDDVINFDYLDFWNEHMQLRDIDYEMLGKIWIYDLRAIRPDRHKPVMLTVRRKNGSVVAQSNLWVRTGYWVVFMCKEMLKVKDQDKNQEQDLTDEKDDDTYYEIPINAQQLKDKYWELLNLYRNKKGMDECKKDTNKLDRCLCRVDVSALLAKCS